jgi:hypothetical protein
MVQCPSHSKKQIAFVGRPAGFVNEGEFVAAPSRAPFNLDLTARLIATESLILSSFQLWSFDAFEATASRPIANDFPNKRSKDERA